MSDYAIFFDKDGIVYQLPVNPEEMEVSTVQGNEKYDILKLGQIVVPTQMELTEYSFSAEFPHDTQPYVETSGNFKDADFYLNLFKSWRKSLEPVRFIASNGIGDDINSLVLIEKLTITEKAGEEGDKYISFNLLEYREYGKKLAVVADISSLSIATNKKKKKVSTSKINPKSNGFHVVKSGDSLWSIARKYYGDGAKYTKIYNANKDKIKNPSLIMSGQKLVIPV